MGDFTTIEKTLNNKFIHDSVNSSLKERVTDLFKIQSLRCFLINFNFNINPTIEYLQKIYELDLKTIKSEVNKLILKEFINAKWKGNELAYFSFNNSYNFIHQKFSKIEENITKITSKNISLMKEAVNSKRKENFDIKTKEIAKQAEKLINN
jgi:predicted transcriptional regulator